jgi:hypothetical protein
MPAIVKPKWYVDKEWESVNDVIEKLGESRFQTNPGERRA